MEAQPPNLRYQVEPGSQTTQSTFNSQLSTVNNADGATGIDMTFCSAAANFRSDVHPNSQLIYLVAALSSLSFAKTVQPQTLVKSVSPSKS